MDYDDWLKEQNKGSLSFTDAMKAGKTKPGQKIVKGNEAKAKTGGNLGGKLTAAANIAKTIADMSPTKHHGPVDKGTPVKANEEPPKGMDVTVGDFNNKSPLPDDDMDYQKKKKQYGL